MMSLPTKNFCITCNLQLPDLKQWLSHMMENHEEELQQLQQLQPPEQKPVMIAAVQNQEPPPKVCLDNSLAKLGEFATIFIANFLMFDESLFFRTISFTQNKRSTGIF